MAEKYSWKDRYEHLAETLIPLWAAEMEWIGETYGEEALDKCFIETMPKVVPLHLTVTKEDVEREGIKAVLNSIVTHWEMGGFEVRVEKVEPDEIVLNVLKCGSKSLLTKLGMKDLKHFCRHCFRSGPSHLRSLGFYSTVKKTGDDSCIKTWKYKKPE